MKTKERRSQGDRRYGTDDNFKLKYVPYDRRIQKRRIYPEDFEHSYVEQVLIARGVIRIADEGELLRVHTIIQKEVDYEEKIEIDLE